MLKIKVFGQSGGGMSVIEADKIDDMGNNQCHLDKLFLIKIGHHILQILENGVSLRNLERDEMNIDP